MAARPLSSPCADLTRGMEFTHASTCHRRAGFIAFHVTDAFLAQGDMVTVADHLSTGLAGRLDPRAVLRKLSVRDARSLTALTRTPGQAVLDVTPPRTGQAGRRSRGNVG